MWLLSLTDSLSQSGSSLQDSSPWGGHLDPKRLSLGCYYHVTIKEAQIVEYSGIKCLSALMHLIISLSTPQLWENLNTVVKVILGAKDISCQRPRMICTIRAQQLRAAVSWDNVSYKMKKQAASLRSTNAKRARRWWTVQATSWDSGISNPLKLFQMFSEPEGPWKYFMFSQVN